jgi:hypothetical protein
MSAMLRLEARLAAVSVASTAPKRTRASQIATASSETLNGNGAEKKRFPNPTPRTAVMPGNPAHAKTAAATHGE